jgi:hypothetical protein
VATPGGTWRAMRRIASLPITPGPLGIDETSPSAEAPWRMAVHASSTDEMQQTLMRGRGVGSKTV